MEADPPLARTHSSPDLAQRLAEIRSGLLAEVERVEAIESGYRLELPNTSDIADALLDFVRSERQYCPFIDVGLGLPPEPRLITLEPRGPNGVQEFTRVTFIKNVASGNVRT